jgi:hyperosmotically inducible periplasmic protein
MKTALALGVIAMGMPAWLACSGHMSSSPPQRVSHSESRMNEAPATRVAESTRHDADNTARNVRDRDAVSRTPLDQSEKKSDIETTRQIRKSLVRDKSLSINAKNVKIITRDGEVTLRGPVKSEKERTKIVANAKRIAGAGKVDDQLEVEARR